MTRAKAAPIDPRTLDELILIYDRAGLEAAEITRRIVSIRRETVPGFTLDAAVVHERQLVLRASLVHQMLNRETFAAEVVRADLDRLDAMQSALMFKATGLDPMTLKQVRAPSEQAARAVLEIITTRRKILRLDEVSALGSGGADFTFGVMTEKQVSEARKEAADADALDMSSQPAQLSAPPIEPEADDEAVSLDEARARVTG